MLPTPYRGLLLSGLALLAGGCSGSGADAPFEHIILISLDTTRADHLGCYGSQEGLTPAIDSIAREGIVFRDVTSPAPTTLASHTSMMTGSYPQTHGVVRNGFRVNDENVMLAEMLRAVGFHTAAILGSFALERRFGFNQGFEHFDEQFDVLILPGGVDQNQRSSAKVTDAALAHLDEARPKKLFLFTHFFDAHLPYTPPEAIARKHVAEGGPLMATMSNAETAVAAHQYKISGQGIGLSAVASTGLLASWIEQALGRPLRGDRGLAQLYSAEIEAMDAQIGRLLQGLEERGYLQKALVIITGDHGETFWEHGDVWNHGLWVHQTTVSVPLVLHFPKGVYASREVLDPVSTIDLVPTLIDLLGLERPARVEGSSLRPALEGRALEHGPVFSQATQPVARHEKGQAWKNFRKPRCIRDGRWKYIHAPYLELEQLFDLQSDPGETHNLLRAQPVSPETLALRARLRAALDTWVGGAQPLDSTLDPTQMQETFERLRAMGYGGGDPSKDE